MAKKTLQEHVDRLLSMSKLNESPKYKQVLGAESQFDVLPDYLKMHEAGSGDTTGNSASTPAAPAPATPEPQGNAAPAAPATGSAPLTGAVGSGSAPATGVTPEPPPDQIAAAPAPAVDPTMEPNPPMDMGPSKDELEKKVMELLLDASKNMSEKISELENMVDLLNQKLESFGAEVEQVKEPTDIEKFTNRKQDSHPYYYNLNDLWNNNTFKARLDDLSKGYVDTPNGIVADFDNLPRFSPHEVKQSFDV
jgi:hypothetical protein